MTSQQIQQTKARFGIVGNAAALVQAVSRALRVAPIDLSVLVTGESGTGKEFFPQIIHANSPRKHARYIAVNCGAIPEGTIDSELFGHEKGAFTGAVATRKGYFEEADGGTIFLDEVAELPLTTQARLLRVLESGEFMKVGSSQVQKTNIRIVAATNVNMAQAVREGRFREDLFYRLSTVEIHVPPLRDRGDDILLLASKFAMDFSERYHVPEPELSAEARSVLMHYRWPGNVRQLKNVIEQVALFEGGHTVDRDTMLRYLPDDALTYTPALSAERTASLHSYEQERELLFSMIFQLKQELQQLTRKVEESGAHGAAGTDSATGVITTFQPLPTHQQAQQPTEADHNIEDVYVTADLSDAPPSAIEPETLEATERRMIMESMQRNGGHRKAVADELRISERTLYRKLKKYGLE